VVTQALAAGRESQETAVSPVTQVFLAGQAFQAIQELVVGQASQECLVGQVTQALKADRLLIINLVIHLFLAM
jgi:hypothetical protein